MGNPGVREEDTIQFNFQIEDYNLQARILLQKKLTWQEIRVESPRLQLSSTETVLHCKVLKTVGALLRLTLECLVPPIKKALSGSRHLRASGHQQFTFAKVSMFVAANLTASNNFRELRLINSQADHNQPFVNFLRGIFYLR